MMPERSGVYNIACLGTWLHRSSSHFVPITKTSEAQRNNLNGSSQQEQIAMTAGRIKELKRSGRHFPGVRKATLLKNIN